ncbi:hypothetical protein MNEG_1779 [Monoraphidium neglectum]|uniref:RAP domain-containing protein n=1 Tax=Monoraphidium neglectum TaxID=145388 RepID=A0A0D2LID1_9CHLO|nr:hypothetical protein MNEG_1779 [Monoraphidium neglectum]KIZ06174.1 hypothetical protein MNEG_1779 [Monoraphidium neglectum]|eukprot:XP_013905193.1 hypothetical protein MNEG_1779 [Monoraphidium neglectum]
MAGRLQGAPPEDDQLRRFLPRDGGEGAGPGGAAGPAAPAATGGAGGDAASLNALVEAAAGSGDVGSQLAALAAHLRTLQAPGASEKLGGTLFVGILRSAIEQREQLADQQHHTSIRDTMNAAQDILNLLAVSAVVSTSGAASSSSSSNGSSSNNSSSNGGNGNGGNGKGGSAGADSAAAVAAALVEGMRAALDEAWRRPAAVARLGGAELTSLCVVLQLICRHGAAPLPPAFLQAVWKRLAALSQRQQRAWRRGAAGAGGGQQGGYEEASAAPAVAPASTPALSAEQLAVCLFCLAAHPGTPAPRLLGAALGAAAACLPRLDSAGVWRLASAGCAWAPRVRGRPPKQAAALAAALAVDAALRIGALEPRAAAAACQLCSSWGAGAEAMGALAGAVAPRLPGWGDGPEAAAAAGWLAPWLAAESDARLLHAALDAALPPGERGVHAAAVFFAAAAAALEEGLATELSGQVFGAALARLVEAQGVAGGAPSEGALRAAAAALAACARAAAPGAGWPAPQLVEAPVQQLVDLALAADAGGDLQRDAFAALAARSAEGSRLRAQRLPELLLVAATEGRRSSVQAGPPQQQQQQQQQGQAPWVGVARACLASLQHRARFLPPPQLLLLLEALGVLGIRPQGMLTSAGLQIASSTPVMSSRELAAAAVRLARLRHAPPLAPAAVAGEACRLAAAGEMGRGDALRTVWALAKLQHAGPAARRLLDVTTDMLLGAEERGGGGAGSIDGAGGGGGSTGGVDGAGGGGVAVAQGAAAGAAPLPALAVVAWASGALRLRPARLRDLLAAAASHPAPPSPQAVSNVLWACARLRLARADGVVAWGVRSMDRLWGDAPALALANTTWALWKLGYQPSSSFTAALMPALGREWGSLDATQLSQVLFVLAKWRAPPPPDRLRAAAARLEREAGALDGPGVCSFASALARLGAPLEHSTLAAAEARLVALSAQEQQQQEEDGQSAERDAGPYAPSGVGGVGAGRARAGIQRQSGPPELKRRRPADASDVALFLGACGARGYTPRSPSAAPRR